MVIKKTELYQAELFAILQHIANDKMTASREFSLKIDRLIKDIPDFPYKHRQSIYFNNENVRDLIIQKYTIFILSIFNKNKPS